MLAAILAGVTAYVFWCQLGTMEQANRDSREASKLENRAWIAPITSKIHTEMGQSGIIFNVPFTNSGKTPALHVSAWIGAVGDFKDIGFGEPSRGHADELLGLDQVGNTSTVPFPSDVIQKIQSGATLYVFGTIWYDDIFGGKHWTQFCFYPGRDMKSFGPCGKHNGTDDNPK